MRYSDSAMNKVMALLEKKTEEFRSIGQCCNGRSSKWSDIYNPKNYDENKYKEYIGSLGGHLFENPYPNDNDGLDDEEWDALCDRRLSEIEAVTEMFPVLLPHRCCNYQACLLPHDLVDKILVLGMFP